MENRVIELTYPDTPEFPSKNIRILDKSRNVYTATKMETKMEMIDILSEMVCEQKYDLLNVNKEKRPIDKDGNLLKNWNTLPYETLCENHTDESGMWGIRHGFHREGKKYTMGLDFDMCGSEHKLRGCETTCALWDEYREKAESWNGCFTSSTEGNMNVLIDYTQSPLLQEKIKAIGKSKFVVANLEILIGGYQVIPPSKTICKINKVANRHREFLALPFYVIPSDDIPDPVRDFIISKMPEIKTTVSSFTPVVDEKWLDLLFNFIKNEVVEGVKKIGRADWFYICSILKSNGYGKEVWLRWSRLVSQTQTASKTWDSIKKSGFVIHGLLNICKRVNSFGLMEWKDKYGQFIPLGVLEKGENDVARYIASFLENIRFSKNMWWVCDGRNLWSQRKDVTAIVISTIQEQIDVVLSILHFKKSNEKEEKEKEKMDDDIKSYNKCRVVYGKSGHSNQVIKCLMTYLLDESFYEKLDENIYQIAYSNGIYDMKTRTFRAGILPTDYLTKTVKFDWEEGTEEHKALVRNELKKICNWNETHLLYYLSVFGFSLTGDASLHQLLFYLRGQSAENGKSVVLEIMTILFNEIYVKKIDSKFFDVKASDQHKTLAELKGIRIAWANEISKTKCDANLIKDLADGTQIPYKVMYGTTAMLNVRFKLFLVSNHTLNIPADKGVERRVNLFQMESKFGNYEDDYEAKKFKKDARFGEKMTGIYKYALLSVLMDAAYDFIQNGLPPIPPEWEVEKKSMMDDNSPSTDFWENNFETGAGFTCSKGDIERRLTESKTKMSIKDFKDELKKNGIKYTYDKDIMTNRVRGLFTGFRIIDRGDENL